MKAKKSGKMGLGKKILLGVLAVIVVLAAVSGGALAVTEKERREGRDLPIGVVDFSKLKDGTYTGAYEGGMYKWRANEVQVTVSGGRVNNIDILTSTATVDAKITDELFDKVIDAQSLQVDAVSQSTITSKSYLKSVENALAKAQ